MTLRGFAPAAPDEEIVYGAAAPGGIRGGDDAIEGWIDAVQREGIERVVCLLSDAQLRRYHALLDDYRRAFGTDAVAHVPIPDHELADEATIREALEALRGAEAAGEPVVVHCLAGLGRTGQVLAAWLVAERGYEPEDAVQTVREGGRNAADAVAAGNATREELYDLLRAVEE